MRDWLRSRPWIHAWLPVVLWMGWIFLLSAQGNLPQVAVGWADLIASCGTHVFLFGVLAILWLRALWGRPHAAIVALLLTALYALSDEFHQAFVPGRDASSLDLICDLAGAGLGLWVYARFKRRSRLNPAP